MEKAEQAKEKIVQELKQDGPGGLRTEGSGLFRVTDGKSQISAAGLSLWAEMFGQTIRKEGGPSRI